MNRLRQFDFVYLASPYSKYPHGIEIAFRDVAKLAGKLLREGVRFHSPIAHTHPIAIYGGIDPLDHSLWLPFDKPYMDAAGAIVVAKLPSWETSFGIAEEVAAFRAAGKPVFYIDPETLTVGDKA